MNSTDRSMLPEIVSVENSSMQPAALQISFIGRSGIPAIKIKKISAGSPNALDLILAGEVDLVIDTPTQGRDKSRDGFLIRRNAIETGCTCLTSLDTAAALVTSLENANMETLFRDRYR